MINAIYTGSSGNGLCCLAVKHGFGYGINSSKSNLCLYAAQYITSCRPGVHRTARMPEHRVMFVDNAFKRYNHERHLRVVARLRPIYATVCDVMTEQQCRTLKVDYHPLRQILAWAETLRHYAEHVIVIPKYDCIDEIPGYFILGYSVPTSYGGAPSGLLERFGDRPTHLLGGSWSQQRNYLYNSELNAVSLDFNHVHKLAMRGQFVDPQGHEFFLNQVLPKFSSNSLYTCMALSLAAIRTGINRWLIDMNSGKTIDPVGGSTALQPGEATTTTVN